MFKMRKQGRGAEFKVVVKRVNSGKGIGAVATACCIQRCSQLAPWHERSSADAECFGRC